MGRSRARSIAAQRTMAAVVRVARQCRCDREFAEHGEHSAAVDQGASVVLLPRLEHEIRGHKRRVWRSDDDVDVIEAISITGMRHGVPLDTTGVEGIGHAGPFHFDVGLSSTHHIARFWGLAATTARKEQAVDHAARVFQPEPVGDTPLLAARSIIPYVHQPDDEAPQGQKADPSSFGRGDSGAVIAAALKAAGLLGQPTDNPLDPRRVVTSTLRAVGVLKDERWVGRHQFEHRRLLPLTSTTGISAGPDGFLSAVVTKHSVHTKVLQWVRSGRRQPSCRMSALPLKADITEQSPSMSALCQEPT